MRRQALEGYYQSILTAFREVDDGLVSIQKTQEQLDAQRRQLAALEDYRRLAQERYDNGYVSYIEVLDAERRLFDAELLEVQVQSDVHASFIATYKAMGGGWVLIAEDVADDAEAERMANEAAGMASQSGQTPPAGP